MDNGFWWGLMVAVPLGLITNMLTPVLQRVFATRSAVIRARLDQRRQVENAQVATLADDPEFFRSWQAQQHSNTSFHHLMLLTNYMVAVTVVVLYVITNKLLYAIIMIAFGSFLVIAHVVVMNDRRKWKAIERGVFRRKGWTL